MARKYSLAHLGCLNWTPPEMIYNAKTMGYDCVGIRSIVQGISGEVDYDFQRHPELFRQTKQAMEETGVTIHDIEFAKIGSDTHVDRYEPAFAAAEELGAVNVITSIWTDDRNSYLPQFEQLCDLAAKYHLKVGLEFVTWASVWNLRQAREILETVNRPNAGILVDTLHAHRSGVTPGEIRDLPRQWLEFAHICGGPKGVPDRSNQEELIFTGREARYYLSEPDNGVDAAAMIRAMNGDTVLAMELPHWERAKALGTFEHQRRVLETTKAYLKASGIV